MWQRMFSIIVKEFIQLSRDRRSMAMVLAPTIFLSGFIFPIESMPKV